MEYMDFSDLIRKNTEVERINQEEHKANSELLSRIAEDKVRNYDVMYGDLKKAGDFLTSVSSINRDFLIDTGSLGITSEIGKSRYTLKNIHLTGTRGIGLTKMSFVFSNNKSGEYDREISLDDPAHYSGKSLSIDTQLSDRVMVDWENVRPFLDKYVRDCGKRMIAEKRNVIIKETSEINRVNKLWIEKNERKTAVA